MWYGQDDHSLIFKLQHIPESPGQWGAGLWARNTPYRYIVVPFAPLFALWGTQPFGYFFVSIFNYFFAALAVYYLALVLTKDKKTSLVAGLIFGAGFIGADTMLRLTNSYQMPHAIIFTCISLAIYKKYIDQKKLRFYLLALALFWFTADVFWIREHGIILSFLGLEVVYNLRLKSIFKSILRMVPFGYIYYFVFFKGADSSGALLALKTALLKDWAQVLVTWVKSIQNIFIPDNLVSPQSGLFTLVFVLLAVALLIKSRQKAMWFGGLFAVSMILVYLVYDPGRSINTTHRYVTTSLAGVSIFFAVLFRTYLKKH